MLAICLNNLKARQNFNKFNRTYLEVVSLWYMYGSVKHPWSTGAFILSDFYKLISFAMMSSGKFDLDRFKSGVCSLHSLIWARDRGVQSLVRRAYATIRGVRGLKTNESEKLKREPQSLGCCRAGPILLGWGE